MQIKQDKDLELLQTKYNQLIKTKEKSISQIIS